MELPRAGHPSVDGDEQRLRSELDELDAARVRATTAASRAAARREALDAELESMAAASTAELARLDKELRRRLAELRRATDAEVARILETAGRRTSTPA